MSYAPRISRRDSTRSFKGRMLSSLDIANDSSSNAFDVGPITITVSLKQSDGVVAAGLGQIRPVARFAAEDQRVLEVGASATRFLRAD